MLFPHQTSFTRFLGSAPFQGATIHQKNQNGRFGHTQALIANHTLGSSRLRYQCELITLVGTPYGSHPRKATGSHPVDECSLPQGFERSTGTVEDTYGDSNQQSKGCHAYGYRSQRPTERLNGLFSSDTKHVLVQPHLGPMEQRQRMKLAPTVWHAMCMAT